MVGHFIGAWGVGEKSAPQVGSWLHPLSASGPPSLGPKMSEAAGPAFYQGCQSHRGTSNQGCDSQL